MLKVEFDNLIRVNKTQAKNLFNNGFDVMLIPCKCDPTNKYWNLGYWINKTIDNSFESNVNSFEYYNCNSELGKYCAYYVKSKMIIHFEFTDNSNPYIFRDSIFECTKELKKWQNNYNIECIKSGFYRLTDKID